MPGPTYGYGVSLRRLAAIDQVLAKQPDISPAELAALLGVRYESARVYRNEAMRRRAARAHGPRLRIGATAG